MTASTISGLSELRHAILEHDTALVEYLIEQGIDPNRTQHYYDFPLIQAIKAKSLEIVTLLVEKGADVNISDYGGFTPLMEAAHHDLSILRYLIEKGACLDARDFDNDTALEWAKDGLVKGATEVLQEAAQAEVRQAKMAASHAAATANQDLQHSSRRPVTVKARPV